LKKFIEERRGCPEDLQNSDTPLASNNNFQVESADLVLMYIDTGNLTSLKM